MNDWPWGPRDESWKEAVGPVIIDENGLHWRPVRNGGKLMICPLCGSDQYKGCIAPNGKIVHKCDFPLCGYAWVS